MNLQANPHDVAKDASAAASEVVTEIEKVHGPIWGSRQEFSKLIVTLASTILVGTITFAEKIVDTSVPSCASLFLIGSWLLFFASICSALLTIWYGGIFQTLRARFHNQMPSLKGEVSKVQATTPEELHKKQTDIVRKHFDPVLEEMKQPDKRTAMFTKAALVTFCMGLAAFIVCGALQLLSHYV